MTWLSVLRRRLKQPDAFVLAITRTSGETFKGKLLDVGDDYLLVYTDESAAAIIPVAHIFGIRCIDA